MPDYDFHQLSPDDFEVMTRDLLQAEWGLTLESFKTGKDGGIDFRYGRAGQNTVVQCKHYIRSALSALLRDLHKEAAKIHKLHPRRYVLVTSVPLSPANKEAIVGIVGGDVLHAEDVLGQDDLNNLLELHRTVEESHYKLWLASRAVLDRVLNNAVVTQSEFHVKKVHKSIPRYVQTTAFPRAMEVLNRDRIVIVAGPPGVGKTTLANLLLYQHLEQGFQAVVIQGDIKDGQSRFQDGVDQIFYYDDFLGATFLGDRGTGLERNADRTLIDFMLMVRSSSSARMVLTTREHILSQALDGSERLRHSELDDHKIVLRISDYTLWERAKVLYNHLYFSDLPDEYQDELLRDEFYFQIIKHPKYNPRLIEWLSSYRRVKTQKASSYREFVVGLLNDSSEIWRHAYGNEISNAARSLLLVLFGLRGKSNVAQLERAFQKLHSVRARRYGFERRPEDFRLASRELFGSFIKATSPHLIDVTDPSVMDLMNNVVREDPENVIDIIEGAATFDQVARLWEFASTANGERVMAVLAKNIPLFAEAVAMQLEETRKVKLKGGGFAYIGPTFEKRFALLIEIADRLRDDALLILISKCFSRLKEEWEVEDLNISDGIAALYSWNRIGWARIDELSDTLLEFRDAVLGKAANGCSSDDLRDLVAVLPTWDLAEESVLSALRKGYLEYQRHIFDTELSEFRSSSQFESLVADLNVFNEALGVDIAEEVKRVLEAKEEFDENESAYADHMQDEWKERNYETRVSENSVRDMFGSLGANRAGR